MMIPPEDIQERLDVLAGEIVDDYAGKDLVLIGVLTGSFMLTADLARKLHDRAAFAFVKVASYGDGTDSKGRTEAIKLFDDEHVSGRHVLIVEDIIDTGLTLETVINAVVDEGPASVQVLVLLDKPARRRVQVPIAYRGFTVPNRFVVGYGIDYAGRHRGLPYVGYIPGI